MTGKSYVKLKVFSMSECFEDFEKNTVDFSASVLGVIIWMNAHTHTHTQTHKHTHTHTHTHTYA